MDVIRYLFHPDGAKRSEAKDRLGPVAVWNVRFVVALSGFGFATGLWLGGRTRGLQFLAENAHRQPKTVKGWFLYHKHKNYEVFHAGMKQGIVNAVKFAFMGGAYSAFELGLESVRDRQDMLNSMGAGLASSLLLLGRVPFSLFKRGLLIGSAIGGLAGFTQDVYALMFGYSLKYGTPTKKWSDYPQVNRFIREYVYKE